MHLLSRIISPSLIPNQEPDDYVQALRVLFSPWKWKKGMAIDEVENYFKNTYNTRYAASFNAGRSAFLALLRSFGIGRKDEVMIQALTCVAVPNSILWAGAKPVFVDIDASFNFDVSDAENKLTQRTRAVVVQHTFGIPADMPNIIKFARRNKLLVIEDCAHALDVRLGGKLLGTQGDAAFFSFGRDKVISSVFGGLAIVQNAHKQAGERLRQQQAEAAPPKSTWILQQLLHVLLFPLILQLYSIQIGKIILYFFQKLHILSVPVDAKEKSGLQPGMYPQRFPNALAQLALHQLSKVSAFSQRRKNACGRYYSAFNNSDLIKIPRQTGESQYLRFPAISTHTAEITKKLKSSNILLGNWYRTVVDPPGVRLDKIGYLKGSCPKAESIAGTFINLPTNIHDNTVSAVIGSLKEALYGSS